MTPRPKHRPLSRHAEIMLEIFQLLNSEYPETRHMVADYADFNSDAREVLAALDAFADEQQEPA